MSMNQGNFVMDNLNAVFEKLEKFITTKTVVGEAIQVGDTTIIPFISVAFGAGTGGGDGQDERGSKGVGGGGGGGAKITPTAVLVIKGDRVEMLPVKKGGGLEKLLDMVPDIVNKFDCCKKSEPTVE
ncbi:MAG: spore germination protein GerW family protein [Clostridia bacterium]|nr:spore germination protein GerW family protein [Clostridia bacterium]